MDRATGQTDSFEQAIFVARYIAALPPAEQYSRIEGIVLSGITAIEGQDISGLNNTLEVVFTHATASTLISAREATKEGTITRGLHEMTVAATEHPYIIRDPRIGQGEPIITGTGVRVRILAEYWRAGTPPEELLQAFPHLTLAQVFDALSYYQDHQPEINALIEQNRVDPTLLHESVRQRS
jgi:uncharacterized protein (DUF433 family)